jgi:hypothetical protein
MPRRFRSKKVAWMLPSDSSSGNVPEFESIKQFYQTVYDWFSIGLRAFMQPQSAATPLNRKYFARSRTIVDRWWIQAAKSTSSMRHLFRLNNSRWLPPSFDAKYATFDTVSSYWTERPRQLKPLWIVDVQQTNFVCCNLQKTFTTGVQRAGLHHIDFKHICTRKQGHWRLSNWSIMCT